MRALVVRNGLIEYLARMIDAPDVAQPALLVTSQPGFGGDPFGLGVEIQSAVQLAQSEVAPAEIAEAFLVNELGGNILCRTVGGFEPGDGVVVSKARQADITHVALRSGGEVIVALAAGNIERPAKGGVGFIEIGEQLTAFQFDSGQQAPSAGLGCQVAGLRE